MVLEYAVIHQMDTSGTNFAPKTAGQKSQNFSKEELGAILKFGAQSLFKNESEDGQQKKLDEMDLDAILKNAEAHDTEADPTGASSGGEAFLQQFAQVQDFKADVSWDDIIPLEERLKAEEEERQKAVEEAKAASAGRRKAAQVAPGVYESASADADNGDGASNRSKSPAEKTSKKGGSASASAGASGGAARKSNPQKSLELSERDVRVLIRGIHRWGDMRYRPDPIIEEGRLQKKNRTVLLDVADELIKMCEDAISSHDRAFKEMTERKEEISSALRQKAVLIECRGVPQINAETTLTRHYGLRLLAEILDQTEDKDNWQLPVDHIKTPVNWSSEWTVADDAKLMVGIYHHGFGQWDYLENDESLGLKDKKKGNRKRSPEGGAKGSPMPSGSSSKNKKARRSAAQEASYDSDESDQSNYSSMDEGECKELMRPCKKELKKLKEGTDHMERDEKVATLRECLSAIGGHIDFLLANDFQAAAEEEKRKRRRHLWAFAAFFWPKKVKPSKLKGIFQKLVGTGVSPAVGQSQQGQGHGGPPAPAQRTASSSSATAAHQAAPLNEPVAKRKSELSPVDEGAKRPRLLGFVINC
ncbi:hypothetical protein L7F22_061665 [Adiantum nelumboides]|nr:hypothetical protein [Adiantum nelumboides]